MLERDPDHKEARRLLGYVPHDGGWATPFAVQRAQEEQRQPPDLRLGARRLGAASGPRRASGAVAKGPERLEWLPVAEADRLRADWNPPWKVTTEHFEIQTNVPLAEAITFGRRLEAFHDLFMTLLADILGENVPHHPAIQEPDTRRPTACPQSKPAPGLLLRFEGRVRRQPEPEART